MKNLLVSRDTIRTAARARIQRVEIPELEGTFLIKSLSWHEANQMGRAIREAPEGEKEAVIDREFRRACVLSLVDEQGERIYHDADIDEIASLDWPIVSKLATEIQKFSGLGVEAAEITKNSTPSSTDASPSA